MLRASTRLPSPLLILEEIPAPAATSVERDPNAPNFDPRYRFETFVVGKANEVACTAAKTLASAETVSLPLPSIGSYQGFSRLIRRPSRLPPTHL